MAVNTYTSAELTSAECSENDSDGNSVERVGLRRWKEIKVQTAGYSQAQYGG
jgi:hypothetical protein